MFKKILKLNMNYTLENLEARRLIDKKDLRIGIWNAYGILNKKIKLEIFLSNQDVKVSIISETHFTGKTNLNFLGASATILSIKTTKRRKVLSSS